MKVRNFDEKESFRFHRCFLLAWLVFVQLYFYMDFCPPEHYF